MTRDPLTSDTATTIADDSILRPSAEFDLSRRDFVKLLGAGLLITTTGGVGLAQRGAGGGRRGGTVAARLHVGQDGLITVMTGKVEVGQGSRAQLTQAAAEELRVGVDQIVLVMGDTQLCPDDGTTAGSRTTPSSVPAVRAGAAAARRLLIELAAKRWQVDPKGVEVRDGVVLHSSGKEKISYAELAKTDDLDALFQQAAVPGDVQLTPVSQWKVLGRSVARPNSRDIVTGAHRFPSDVQRLNMLYGKVLRPPSYGATLSSIDLAPAEAMQGVIVVRDGDFVGCAAPTSFLADQAVQALAKTASWQTAPHPSSKEVFSYLKEHARSGGGGRRGSRGQSNGQAKGSAEKAIAGASKTLSATYQVAYVQHVPMETRAAVAEWNEGKVTVWTGSQAPNGVHGEVARTLGLPQNQVRVIVPDTGGGFGGKHTGEVAMEAARLARKAGRPVSLQWTREEEFTWAYFRPAALIEIRAGLDEKGKLVAWDFTNINSGGAAVQSPYEIPSNRAQYVPSDPPLRQGSYRALAATANNFARECFMDELAAAAQGAPGADPLAFRLAHLGNPRLRAVLETAATRFDFSRRQQQKKDANVGVGLACGTEKGSYVAACVEIAVDREQGTVTVRRVCEVFECGAIQNPENLRRQVAGCIIMGLGPALREEIRFEGGKVLNGNLELYEVPRMADVPELEIHLLDRPDLPSVGAGETPIIAVAPAIAAAVFDATGVRIRQMPIRGDALKQA
jgi:CO/xanthine dehydrogenase Mo-binding subunit